MTDQEDSGIDEGSCRFNSLIRLETYATWVVVNTGGVIFVTTLINFQLCAIEDIICFVYVMFLSVALMCIIAAYDLIKNIYEVVRNVR